MLINEYKDGRIFAGRLDYDSDLLESINKICIDKGVRAGFVNIIGALSTLKIGYFKQDSKEYIFLDDVKIDSPLEIVSCTGNISIKDAKPFSHLHIIGSDRDGRCIGGHLMPGTKIFAAEFFIKEITGTDLVRELDPITQLPLWKINQD